MRRVRLLQRGIFSLKVSVIIPLAMLAAVIGWFIYVDHRRQYWDETVRTMCAKEGEAVVLQRVEIVQGDEIPPTPDERYADTGATYVSRWQEEVIRPADPRVLLTKVSLIRVRDQAILGHQIQYARIGGDVGPVDNPSTFSCLDLGVKSVESLVFFKKKEPK